MSPQVTRGIVWGTWLLKAATPSFGEWWGSNVISVDVSPEYRRLRFGVTTCTSASGRRGPVGATMAVLRGT
jgi:hypothetical protein